MDMTTRTNHPDTIAELHARNEANRHIVNCGCDDCEADRIQDERETRLQERWDREADREWLRTHKPAHPPVWRG